MLPHPLRTSQNFFYRAVPLLFWRKYASRAKKAGVGSLLVVLSYDCDTDEDAEASAELFGWLKKRGMAATFAVPGEQLKTASNIYRAINEGGAKFMNHGGAAHTEWREGRYWSTTFYDQMTFDEVEVDIRLGHAIFQDVLGEAPRGFRAPHFGHFSATKQLDVIYDTLRSLGTYTYSSTTTSRVAHRYGPVRDAGGLLEFPIVGSFYWPIRFFDSYGHLIDKQTRRSSDAYGKEFLRTVEILKKNGLPAVLNYYADPSHLVGNTAYLDALEGAKALGAEFVDFDALSLRLNPERVLA